MASWRLLALVVAGCGARGATPMHTAIVLGPDPAAGEIRARLATVRDVEVATLAEPTSLAPSPSDLHGHELARARKAYVDADFPRCRTTLAPIDAIALLARHRATAARVLMWRVACFAGEGNREAARKEALAFAAAGLEVPADVSQVTPDVEALLADATSQLAKAPPAPLRVRVTPTGARIAVDGGSERCVAPCTVMLAPGAHALSIAADGYEPVVRRVDVPGEPELAVELADAAPPVIAAQLQLRIGRGAPADDPATLALAGRAVRARRILVLGIQDTRLVGATYHDGRVGARGERRATPGDAAALVDELLAKAVPATPLARRPVFWISLAAASALAAGITGYLLFRPDPESRVVFP
jgi:hypothetical protein